MPGGMSTETKYEMGEKTACRPCAREGITTIAQIMVQGTPMCEACARFLGVVAATEVKEDPPKNHFGGVGKELDEEGVEYTVPMEEEELAHEVAEEILGTEVAESQTQTKKENRMKSDIDWVEVATQRFVKGVSVTALAHSLKISVPSVYVHTNKLKREILKAHAKPEKASAIKKKALAPPTNGSVSAYQEALNILKARYAELSDIAEAATMEQEKVGEIIEQLEEASGTE